MENANTNSERFKTSKHSHILEFTFHWIRLFSLFALIIFAGVSAKAEIQISRSKPASTTAAKIVPNVLLIMTDDQGWGDISMHGAPGLQTPTLDELGRSGAQFERFYVSPVCAPTRASLLTGRYHLRTGVFGVTRARETMRAEEVTVAEVFQKAGYATGAFGKWHNGAHYPNHPNGQGFEEFFGFCAGHWNNYFDTELERNGEPVQTQGFITDVLTDAAIDFMNDNAGSDQPFFCYVPYNAPHSPWQVPEKYYQKYLDLGLDPKAACAYGMVENLDENISKMLECLKKNGIQDNTIVIFLTDNGPNSDRFNGDMKGRKGSVHEGGVRVPLFIRWPNRIPSGTQVEPIAAHIDLLPTLMDLCDLEWRVGDRPTLDGTSLVTTLIPGACATEGRPSKAELLERSLYTHQVSGGKIREWPGAVRTQRWRWVSYGKEDELYDMRADPGQLTNVASRFPQITQELGDSFKSWFQDVTSQGLEIPPVPVGANEFLTVRAPAHESRFEGQVKFKGGQGWANDWLTNWTSTKDRIFWDLDVLNSGEYEVALLYTCPASDVGSVIEIRIQDQSRTVTIDTAHDPGPLHSPDLIERKEVYEKNWAKLPLGIFKLKQGACSMTMRALKLPGDQVMEVKAAIIKRL